MSVEQQLRDTFERYAERTPAPVEAHTAVLVRHRRSQRRRLVGGTLAVGFVLAIAIPMTVQVLDRPPDGVDVSVDGAAYVPGPPRGSLATDAAFLAGVIAVPWVIAPDASQPPVADRRVIFAGEVPGGRWARVVAQVDGQWHGVWLTGPVRAEGESLRPVDEADLSVTEVQVRGDFQAPENPLVVLAEPGDQVGISEATLVAADGSAARTYRQLEVDDGVAVTGLPGAKVAALAIRVTRDERPVSWTGGIQGELGEDEWPSEGITAAIQGARGTPDPRLTPVTVRAISSPTGLSPGQVDPRVLWGDSIDASSNEDVHALVLTAELPSGARALVGGCGRYDDSGGTSESPLLELYPAGAALPVLIAMRCDIQGPEVAPRLVVVAPPAATSARVLAGETLLTEVPLDDGIATIDFPDGADRVVALDADGLVLADEPIGGVTDLHLLGDTSIG